MSTSLAPTGTCDPVILRRRNDDKLYEDERKPPEPTTPGLSGSLTKVRIPSASRKLYRTLTSYVQSRSHVRNIINCNTATNAILFVRPFFFSLHGILFLSRRLFSALFLNLDGSNLAKLVHCTGALTFVQIRIGLS